MRQTQVYFNPILSQKSVTVVSSFSSILRDTFNHFSDFIVSFEDLGDKNFESPDKTALPRDQYNLFLSLASEFLLKVYLNFENEGD